MIKDTQDRNHSRVWLPVCPYNELTPGRGVTALLEGKQVAVFRDRRGFLYAVDNYDPFSGAYVIARGLLGSRGDSITVASPIYKQVFDLRSGQCLDEESVRLPVYEIRIDEAGVVHVLVERPWAPQAENNAILVDVAMPSPTLVA